MFSVEVLYKEPGASFFFNLSANTKTFSSKFKGLLSFLFLLSIFSSYFSFRNWFVPIFQSLIKSYTSLKYSPAFGFKLLFLIVSGASSYFVEFTLFMCCVTFLIKSRGLSLLPCCFYKRFPLNRSFLNTPIFCSTANAFPPSKRV